ncbi:MAG: class I SAM-dependent methyltransferase, partial [Solirubrobacteraceae bacterium]
AEIACYYEQSRWAYRIFHSSDGAMHMALNPDGRFDKHGYYGQAREVERLIGPDTERVLELATGNGFNLRYLAQRHPHTSFTGVDLVARHVAAAQAKAKDARNLRFLVGDFHRLAFEAGSFDILFVVESLCHATDQEGALREAHRVLRSGGLLVVIDGWRTRRFSRLPAVVQRAAVATEQAMSVGRAWVIEDWRAAAVDAGFEVVDDRDLTLQILPTVRRLERIARVILSHPRMARTAQRLLPERFLMNAIAVYLMQLTLVTGAHTYRSVALRRG